MSTPRRSHLIPRTRDGRVAIIAFALLFLVSMPPVTHTVLNRIEPSVLGMPFFYVTLFVVYTGLICILLWALKRGV